MPATSNAYIVLLRSFHGSAHLHDAYAAPDMVMPAAQASEEQAS
jgi:hypothetical protein